MSAPWDRFSVLDAATTAQTERLLQISVHGLPQMYREDTDSFAFTRARRDDGTLELRGTSLRYGAIVALGAYFLPEAEQKAVLAGRSLSDFIASLVGHVDGSTNLGDAALILWATAQAGHPLLPVALDRLRRLDRLTAPEYVVETAWVVAGLAAARHQVDVEAYLGRARDRLLGCVVPGSPVFPHVTGPGLVKTYRSHIACFADQVYPIQALARLHHSGHDPEALHMAMRTAAQICRLQGDAGQWWWHYDARTGAVVEGYPVYTVHQHAMGPMALLDLTEAGGGDYAEPIRRGLTWLDGPPELGADAEPMVLDEAGVTWRKVYRGDPRKVVRGLHSMTTRAVPGLKVPGVDAVYKPRAIDYECRPYEFGWLLFSWLGGIGPGGRGQA
jgi:hypothetical protein